MATRNVAAPAIVYNAENAQAAFEALRQRLDALRPDQVVELRSDLEAVILGVLGVLSYLEKNNFAQNMADVPERHFNRAHLPDLNQVCWAGWYLHAEAELLQKHQSRAQVPKELWDAAREVEARMQKCTEYHLSDIPEAKIRLDQLRPGTGYLDTAKDMLGYALLYEQYPDELKDDKRLYDPADVALARRLANQILALMVGEKGTNLAEILALRERVWSLLVDLYDYEVAPAARWFYRRDPEVDTLFPTARSLGRGEIKRKSSEEPT